MTGKESEGKQGGVDVSFEVHQIGLWLDSEGWVVTRLWNCD